MTHSRYQIYELVGYRPSSGPDHPHAATGETSVSYWRRSLKAAPDDLSRRLGYAEALYAEGNHDAAAGAYRKLLVLDPSHVLAGCRLAACRFRAGDNEDALLWLKRLAMRCPEDAALRVAALALCLRHGDARAARGLAELWLAGPPQPARIAHALVHFFRLIGDRKRALKAASAGVAAHPRDPAMRILAAEAAEWAGDLVQAASHYGALAEIAPSGVSHGLRVRALDVAGDASAAANAIGSAIHLFARSPVHLADLAVTIGAPGYEHLKRVVLSELSLAADEDPDAGPSLVLAHYRLGDWKSAAGVLGRAVAAPETSAEAVATAAANLRTWVEAGETLPLDMASEAFGRGLLLPESGRGGPHTEEAVDGPALLLLGGRLPNDRERLLLDIVRRARGPVAVRQTRAPGLPADWLADAGLLSGAWYGIGDFRVEAKGSDASEAPDMPPAFGYLHPAMVAETAHLRRTIRSLSPCAVHVADPGLYATAGLAALHEGAPALLLHLAEGWEEKCRDAGAFVEAAVRMLLGQKTVRAVLPSLPALTTLPETRRPAVAMPAAIDLAAFRNSSGGVARHRAAESLEVDGAADAGLLAIVGEPVPDDAPALAALADALRTTHPGLRPVLFRPGAKAVAGVDIMAWPEDPAPFLAHVRLAAAWRCDAADEMHLLQLAAMSVPVAGVATDRWPAGREGAPPLPPAASMTPPEAAVDLPRLLADPAALAAAAETQREWVRSSRPLRNAIRRFEKLNGWTG
ncbi:MAG: hypothetical protein ACMVY4_08155 [Minwuia sp.]|uniref:hypothetical protein n=1 Tax=Minwuia sp. TaxID=2493630 RepID=UPI003A848CEF